MNEPVTKYPLVQNRKGFTTPYKRTNIITSLIQETALVQKYYDIPGLTSEEAESIAVEVEKKILSLNQTVLTGPLIRELVNMVLLERGLDLYRNVYSRVGLPVHDAYEIDVGLEGNGDNANLQENAETSHKRKADKISKEQYLLLMPPDVAELHNSGDLHIHDLEYFHLRPFCQDYDLRYFFYYGLMPDGLGTKASVAGPAKRPEVAILHSVKALGSGQTNFAGGQGYYNFLPFIAPYLKDQDYDEIKHLMQMFVYEMTQMMVARGGQVVFSSIQLSPGVPNIWKDKPVVARGRIYDGTNGTPLWTYGSLEREVRLAFKALMEVMLEGDITGKPFNFPKPEISIEPQFVQEDEEFNREHPELPTYQDLYLMSFELSSKFGTPYYDNQIPPYRGAGEGISCYQCLPGQTPIHIQRDEKEMIVPIRTLRDDDRVLTPDLGYQSFEGILTKYYTGKLLEFHLEWGHTFRCTPDHSVPVIRDDITEMQLIPAKDVLTTDRIAIRCGGHWIWISIEKINTIGDYEGVVYDPINVPGHMFVIETGIVTGNCCAYQFSKNIENDVDFENKLYFRDGKHFSMGSWCVVSLNCPRAAYRANHDDTRLIDELKSLMYAAITVFHVKKQWMGDVIERGRVPFATQRPIDPNTGERGDILVDFDGLVYTIGVIGINEMVKHHTGFGIHEDPKSWRLAVWIMMEMKLYAQELSEKYGITIALARTPAETTGQRFAVVDLLSDEWRENAREVVQGDVETAEKMVQSTSDLPIYYTNGTHIPPGAPVTIGERVKYEHIFFPIVDGGNIFHIWLPEERPDPRGLMEMAMHLCKTTQIGYFAFTRDLTIPLHQWTDYRTEEAGI